MKPTKQWAVLPICVAWVCVAWAGGWAQSRQVVCDRGSGHFEASFLTGVTVRVGAVKSGGFATRACEAALRWGNEREVVVQTAAQVDIDVLGADLGLGVPVVAFVTRPAQDNSQATYEIWSMEKTPRRLLTLTGEAAYRAVDAEFNGQVAIWTTDAAAVEGFAGLDPTGDVSPPLVALRFEHGRLVDVSAWYRAQYDRQIASLRDGLTAEELAEFRKSDGQLKPGSIPAAQEARLRKTRAMVLEIVWAYLYSGRPERAWAELETAWPEGDVARVKAAMVAARARGIEAQLAKVAPATRPPKWMETPSVYEYLKPVAAQGQTSGRLMYGAPGVTGSEGPVFVKDEESPGLYEADKEPQPIVLWRPPPSAAEQELAQGEETVLLTIDGAGKVESAQMRAPGSDPQLLQAAKDWKFIPALLDGKPVAYRLKMDVRLLR
jgi:outer membrane biosynthesis protein TonB